MTFVPPRRGHVVSFLLITLCGAWAAGEADAQLFGAREVGRSPTRRASPSLLNRASNDESSRRAPAGESGPPLESIGTIVDESARFLRGNRQATDFVGADTAESERFIGTQQSGLGEMIESAVDEGLEIETGEDANQTIEPVIPPRLLLNAPRLKLGFSAPAPREDEISVTVLRHLQATLPDLDSNSFEVSVEEGVAILRGSVASERDRKMAALLVGFEPGIGQVRNELTVASLSPSRTDSLSPSAPGGPSNSLSSPSSGLR